MWACTVELVGVLVVGTASYLVPDAFPDKTVWSHFGQGYGFVPLVLPVLGLLWFRKVERDAAAAEYADSAAVGGLSRHIRRVVCSGGRPGNHLSTQLGGNGGQPSDALEQQHGDEPLGLGLVLGVGRVGLDAARPPLRRARHR